MSFCTNCGNYIEDDARFCASCGAQCVKTESQTEEEPVLVQQPAPVEASEQSAPKKEKRPVKKGKIIGILCAVVLLIGTAVGGYFALQWYNSPEQQLLRALKAGEYETVLDMVDDNASLKYSEDLTEQLQKRIETIKTDYIAETMEYTNVLMELETIQQIEIDDLEELIGETRTYVEKLNASRTAFATAESFFASANYVEAIAQYKLVIQDDSNYETAKAKASEAVGLYRAKVLEDAATYASSGTYANAITLLQAALVNLPDDAQITQQLLIYEKAQADQILSTALAEAAQYAAAKDYLSAISVLEQYIKENGENVDVGLALNDYKNCYSAMVLEDALAKAKAYADTGDYLAAMKTLKTYTSDYGTNASIVVAQNEYTEKYVDTVLVEAEGKVDSGDYPGAITSIRNGLVNTPDHAKLTARLTTYCTAYEEEIIVKSEALLAQRDFDGAIDWIVIGLETLPESEALLAQGDKIWNAMPKSFVDVFDPYQSENYEECANGRTFFMSGEERTNGLIWDSGGYAFFNLDGQYGTLSFDVGHIDGTGMADCTFKIYADGELVMSKTVAPDSFPEHIEVNISNVRQLRIEVSCGFYNYRSQIGMADMIIE